MFRKKKTYYKLQQTLRKEILENFVIDILLKELNKPQTIEKMITNILKVQENIDSGCSFLTNLYKEKVETQNTLNNIMKAVELGVVNNTTNKRMIELENKLEDIERQIIVEKSKTNFKLTKEDIVTYLNDALKLEPQLLINYIVNQIILFDDKMQIYFNSPTIKTTIENRTRFSTKIYKLPHIIQNKPQPEMIDILVELYV